MPSVALVLGAGGVTGGAFHAGVLAALTEATGWDARSADVVIGTSAGAATAAALRAGLSPVDMAARARGDALSDEGQALLQAAGVPTGPPPIPGGGRMRVGRPAAPNILAGALRRPWQVRPSAVLAGLLPEGTVPTDAIADGIDALHPGGWPTKPMWICAVRLRDGALVVFGRPAAGDGLGRDTTPEVRVGSAVAASCAIPGYFAPVEIGDDRYVDGGAHSFTNVGEAARADPDLVIVSSPMSRTVGGRYAPGTAIREAGRAQLAMEVQRLRRRGVTVETFRPSAADEKVMGLNAMDPSRRADVVRQVHASALEHIARIGDRLAGLR